MSSLSVWCWLVVRKTSPTVSFSANPASVKQGQCATLTWSSTDAATVSIDQGVGKVDAQRVQAGLSRELHAIYDHRSR